VLKEDPGEAEDHRHEHRQENPEKEPEVGSRFGEAIVDFLFETVDSPLVPADPHESMEAPPIGHFKRRYRIV
jgi:hypothetical protein